MYSSTPAITMSPRSHRLATDCDCVVLQWHGRQRPGPESQIPVQVRLSPWRLRHPDGFHWRRDGRGFRRRCNVRRLEERAGSTDRPSQQCCNAVEFGLRNVFAFFCTKNVARCEFSQNYVKYWTYQKRVGILRSMSLTRITLNFGCGGRRS